MNLTYVIDDVEYRVETEAEAILLRNYLEAYLRLRRVEKPSVNGVCRGCGNAFVPRSSRQKFCEKSCMFRHHQRMFRKRKKIASGNV